MFIDVYLWCYVTSVCWVFSENEGEQQTQQHPCGYSYFVALLTAGYMVIIHVNITDVFNAFYFVLCSLITQNPSYPVPFNTRNNGIGDTAAAEANVNVKINVFLTAHFQNWTSSIRLMTFSKANFFFGKPSTGVSMNGTTINRQHHKLKPDSLRLR